MLLIETISCLCEYTDCNDLEVGIPTNHLKEILLRCTFNIQFTFDTHIYRQTDDVAMGSPLGILLTDCFMSKLENDILKETIQNFHFYCRYIDDTFIICDSEIQIEEILDFFNTAHKTISFTSTEETGCHIPFLDISLTKMSNGTLKRLIYRKPTWNGQYLNFNSWAPLS